MELPRLRTQLLIATLLIIGLLMGALLFIVRHTVRSEIAKQVEEGTDASLHAFESVQREHEVDLSRTAAILAELPTLKALMTTRDAPTVQDASDPFWRLAGSDLFLLAGADRKVLGWHVAATGWTRADAESALGKSLDQGEDSAWWYADGQLYWVFFVRLRGRQRERNGARSPRGGLRGDSMVAAARPRRREQIVLATDRAIIASTLSPAGGSELQRRISQKDFGPDSAHGMLSLGSDHSSQHRFSFTQGPPHAGDMLRPDVGGSSERVHEPTERHHFRAGLLGRGVGRFSPEPRLPHDYAPSRQSGLGVRALAAGDYVYSVTPRGSIEVAELGQAFSKMRDDLRLSQEKIASERVAALGRAANSISHDLRHYLAAVVANAEFLYEADKLKMNKDEIYEEIQTASKQMIDLLDSLRELAREGAAISPVPASIEQTVGRAADAVLAIPDLRRRTVKVCASGEMNGVFDPKRSNARSSICCLTPARRRRTASARFALTSRRPSILSTSV